MTGRCNVCGWSDRFLRLDRGREGTVCRNCGSTSRNRAVGHVFARILDDDQAVFRWTYRRTTRVLESSARGALAMYFRMKFDYYGTEFDPAKIAAGEDPRAYADFQKLHYDDETFDFVVASDVFEHIRHDAEAMREVQRVLKTGGYLILTVPYDEQRAHTIQRVDTSGPTDVHLLPAHYHGGGGHTLAYREYGRDLIDLMRAPDFFVEQVAVAVPEHGITPQSVFVGRKDRPVALHPARALRAGSSGPMVPFRLFVALKYRQHPFGPIRDFCPYNFVRGFPQLYRDARFARRS
ncbi:MAG: class I SAM-dependent methyltransferase [Candidatus Latescibacteria bacterium]|nr:class I SAM-dependent methyltransferase [Candidatus Latescibacterota bacterium]